MTLKPELPSKLTPRARTYVNQDRGGEGGGGGRAHFRKRRKWKKEKEKEKEKEKNRKYHRG